MICKNSFELKPCSLIFPSNSCQAYYNFVKAPFAITTSTQPVAFAYEKGQGGANGNGNTINAHNDKQYRIQSEFDYVQEQETQF